MIRIFYFTSEAIWRPAVSLLLRDGIQLSKNTYSYQRERKADHGQSRPERQQARAFEHPPSKQALSPTFHWRSFDLDYIRHPGLEHLQLQHPTQVLLFLVKKHAKREPAWSVYWTFEYFMELMFCLTRMSVLWILWLYVSTKLTLFSLKVLEYLGVCVDTPLIFCSNITPALVRWDEQWGTWSTPAVDDSAHGENGSLSPKSI